jgi:predicted nucleotidyltransferase
MGTRVEAVTMADALFSRTQQRVLSLLYGQPERSYPLMELIELANSGRGAVQREVQRLTESGLVTVTAQGRQRVFQANRKAPIFNALREIVKKLAGIEGALRDALDPIVDKIDVALLYGSVAKRSDTATSDIDVLIVSDVLTLEDVFAALQGAEKELGRSVSPTLYSRDEFLKRRCSRQPFLSKVLAGDYVTLVGSLDAAGATR